MDRRAILVDVDGVLVRHPGTGGWSANLERDIGIPVARLQEAFFTPHWRDVVHGRAALRDRLAPVLAELAPDVSCDRLIAYWFDHDAHIDQRLLDDLADLRAKGVELHLATVQEHERAAYLWDRLRLRDRFDGIHYSAALGHAKPAIEFYRTIEARTGLTPKEVFFIDDTAVNVAAARDCGWTAAVWTGDDTLGALIDRHGWHVG